MRAPLHAMAKTHDDMRLTHMEPSLAFSSAGWR